MYVHWYCTDALGLSGSAPEGNTMTSQPTAPADRSARLNMRIAPDALDLLREAADGQVGD